MFGLASASGARPIGLIVVVRALHAPAGRTQTERHFGIVSGERERLTRPPIGFTCRAPLPTRAVRNLPAPRKTYFDSARPHLCMQSLSTPQSKRPFKLDLRPLISLLLGHLKNEVFFFFSFLATA